MTLRIALLALVTISILPACRRDPPPDLSALAKAGDLAAVKAALAAGAAVDGDGAGEPPLLTAVRGDHLDVADALLGAGANAQVRMGDLTLLHLMTDMGFQGPADVPSRVKWIERLVAGGADPKAVDSAGVTALHMAAAAGQVDLVSALAEAGGDVMAVTRSGESVLRRGVASGAPDVIATLLSLGAGPGPDECTPTRSVMGVVLNGEAALFRPLLAAVPANPALAMAKARTQTELARVDAPDAWCMTALGRAILAGEPQVVTSLIGYGARPNAHSTGWLPFNLAARHGKPDMIAALVAGGARSGTGSASYAARNSVDTLRAVLDAGAKLEADTLCVAARTGDPKRAVLLVERGMAVDGAPDNRPLICGADHPAMIGALLKAGARPNLTDASGETALHAVARRGDVKLIERLLAAGADPTLEGGTPPQTPADLARIQGHDAAVKALSAGRGP